MTSYRRDNKQFRESVGAAADAADRAFLLSRGWVQHPADHPWQWQDAEGTPARYMLRDAVAVERIRKSCKKIKRNSKLSRSSKIVSTESTT